ncbi:DUF3048 domain-containing protein [Modestobacter marinus]|uniref:DUF3048 domain-containing protein n=1 Tax=Modestobacter marinus TaxID=477641 RepID=UPI001C9683B0|nr:DUF3048 domain-containing protein [Modestobacter marinus]
MPRSTAPRRRSGPSNGSRPKKGAPAKKRTSAKGRRKQRPRRGRRAALLVLLVAAVGLGWQATGRDLTDLPFLDSIAGAPTTPTWPLTGVPAEAAADRPALAVKIENSVDARPQTGLNAADVVWEQVVEGGITRFVAVYHSTLPPEIGPVRSIRPMDPAIAAPLHGLLAFSGGVPTYVDAAGSAGLQVLTQDSGIDGFYRWTTRRAPHNVYAAPEALVAQADDAHRAAPTAQFAYPSAGQQPTAVTAGQPTGTLALTMSGVGRPHWSWDAESGRWLRAEGSAPAVEADGSQIGATNVVVLRVDVVSTDARDPAGNPVPETILTGSGEALVASGGHAVAATWSKPRIGDPVTLTDTDGDQVTLAPGNTWVELVPNRTGAVATG